MMDFASNTWICWLPQVGFPAKMGGFEQLEWWNFTAGRHFETD
jgi:hypothetical protein